jgi:hypothetical protein
VAANPEPLLEKTKTATFDSMSLGEAVPQDGTPVSVTVFDDIEGRVEPLPECSRRQHLASQGW